MKIPRWLDHAASWSWRLLLVFALVLAVLWVLAAVRVARNTRGSGDGRGGHAPRTCPTLAGDRRSTLVAATVPIGLILCSNEGSSGSSRGKSGSARRNNFQSDRVRIEIETWLMAEPLGPDERQIGKAESAVRSSLVGGARIWGVDQGTLSLTNLSGSILALVLTFLFTKDSPTMWQWLVTRQAPAPRAPFDRAGRAARDTMAACLRSVPLVGIFDGVLIGLGLWSIGVPLILPLILLTILAAMVPVVGAFAAAQPSPWLP